MKPHLIITLSIALSLPTQAQQKPNAEKVVNTLIDAIFGDDPQPAAGKGKTATKAAAPVGDTQSFGGVWAIEGGADKVTVTPRGTAARVKWSFANGSEETGVGVEVGGNLAVGYGGADGHGVAVFRISGGKLSGTGAVSKNSEVVAFSEALSGPEGLSGKYESSRGGTVTIKRGDNDAYLLVWSKGGRAGFGRKLGSQFVVAFHDADPKQANLAVYAPRGAQLTGLWWSDFGTKGGNENLQRTAGRTAGAAPAAAKPQRMDKYGNIIPDGPPPAGLEKPIDMPAAPAGGGGQAAPAAAPAVAAPARPGGPVAAPAKGGNVDLETARRQLREDMPRKIAEFMKLHNDARAEVGVPPLQWDDKLAAYAQEWAENTAARSKMEHRPGGIHGENLAGYLPQYGERPVHGAMLWYGEKKDYNGEKVGDEKKVVGHYTQMVWRNSTHVGFGVAIQKDGMAMLCANYSPAGNMIGEHPYKDGGKAPAPAAAPAANNAPKAAGAPAPAAPVVGGMALQLAKGWTNTQQGKTVTSVSPDSNARVVVTTVTGSGQDGPWDDVQARMAKILAPHFPGLGALSEVSTEHDVFRHGVGMRVVTYTATFGGQPVDLVVDFARENNVDGKGLVLVIRCVAQGNAALAAEALKVAESIRLKK